LWAVREGFREGSSDSRIERSLTAWGALILLALGLSADNLLVGFSLGLRGHDPLGVAGVISGFSMLFAWIGVTLGARTGRRWEKPAKLGAGALLVALAVGVWVGWI
jgi:manganese efflux pump family protein